MLYQRKSHCPLVLGCHPGCPSKNSFPGGSFCSCRVAEALRLGVALRFSPTGSITCTISLISYIPPHLPFRPPFREGEERHRKTVVEMAQKHLNCSSHHHTQVWKWEEHSIDKVTRTSLEAQFVRQYRLIGRRDIKNYVDQLTQESR